MNDVKEVPSFLKPAELTKPDANVRHTDKLREIATAMDESDAKIICQILSEKFPGVMFDSLRDTCLFNKEKLTMIFKDLEGFNG